MSQSYVVELEGLATSRGTPKKAQDVPILILKNVIQLELRHGESVSCLCD